MGKNADKIKRQQDEVLKFISGFITVMSVEARRQFDDSFKDQGFTNNNIKEWKPRKNDKDPGRAILIKSGDLRRSIKEVSRTSNSVTIGSDLPYAEAHNKGLTVGHGAKLPKRQFMGASEKLVRTLKNLFQYGIKKIFK